MKKVISILLSVLMLCSVTTGLNLTAYAADTTITGKCGENVTYLFDSTTGTLTISGTGNMYDYSGSPFDKSAFFGDSDIKVVVIKGGVTSIGSRVFDGCSGLTNITIPDSVTSIGEYAFISCTSLMNVTIPDSVTSVGRFAFSCGVISGNLISIVILSKNCTLDASFVIPCKTIYGFANSTAEKYAALNHIDFVKIYCNDYNLEHTYSKTVLEKSTCKECGKISYTCDRCSKSYTETTPALGGEHDYESKIDKQPTCITKGVTRYTCSRCGDSYNKDDISALGHSYVSKVVQPTCTGTGVTRYTCSRCGDSYDKDEVTPLGHNYVSKVVKRPTCTVKGVTRYTCSRCGDSYDKDDIAALGHSYDEKVAKNPTCEKEGIRQYTCSRCKYSYTVSIPALGHDMKLAASVKPTLTADGYDFYECQRPKCDYTEKIDYSQQILDYNKKVFSNGTNTYKIDMEKSGYLVFDFVGESKLWSINIYDEDDKKIDNLTPQYKEFYKKSYLQMGTGETVPNTNQIVALFAGTYYVEFERLEDSTNDNFSGNYEFSVAYTPSAETINETKYDFYYDAPTAKNIELNRIYKGFLGGKYAAVTYSGKDLITVDERDAYKFEIPKGNGWSQLSLTLSSKTFGPFDSDCIVTIYNSEFEACAEFVPLSVSSNQTNNEIAYLYEGVYYIAVENRNSNLATSKRAPVEYTFTTNLKPSGAFACVTHHGILTKTQSPTCIQDGYKLYVCQICHQQYKEIVKALGHTIVYDDAVAPTCVSSGLTSGSHCTTCGAVVSEQKVIAAKGHTYRQTATPATISKSGKVERECSVCGAVTGKTVIAKASNIKLNKTAYTYNGKVQKPSVTVKDSKGKTLKNGTDYTVSYPKGMKNVGKYTVKVTLKGNYSGTKSLTYNINPKGTSVSKVTAAKKGFKVTWKKQATQTTGYQVQYSTSSKFKKAKTVTISKNKTTSKSVSKLSAKKKYYVRVRTYKTVKIGGKSVKLYSGWSKAKSVTTKK